MTSPLTPPRQENLQQIKQADLNPLSFLGYRLVKKRSMARNLGHSARVRAAGFSHF